MSLSRLPAATAVLLLAVLEFGCIAFPTKLPKRTRGAGGVEIRTEDVDLSFIKIGTTHRDEVSAKLAKVDCGAPQREFFWGRWSQSSWGVVAGAITDTGPDKVEHGTGRHWHLRNVLVNFDANGITQSVNAVDDDEQLWHELLVRLRHSQVAQTRKAVQVQCTDKRYRYMTVSPDSLEFVGTKPRDNFSIQRTESFTFRLRSQFRPEMVQSPQLVCYRLEVTSSVRPTHPFSFCAAGNDLLRILAQLDDSSASAPHL